MLQKSELCDVISKIDTYIFKISNFIDSDEIIQYSEEIYDFIMNMHNDILADHNEIRNKHTLKNILLKLYIPYSKLSSPSKRPTLSQIREGDKKQWFLFSKKFQNFSKFYNFLQFLISKEQLEGSFKLRNRI